ncbi:MAG: hypothetical protein RR891_00625 [Clostridium sp.]
MSKCIGFIWLTLDGSFNKLLRGIFNNIDFDNVRKNIGSVRITEIEEIHGTILDMINLKKQ